MENSLIVISNDIRRAHKKSGIFAVQNIIRENPPDILFNDVLF